MSTGECYRCVPPGGGSYARFPSTLDQKNARCKACGAVYWLWDGPDTRRRLRVFSEFIAESERARRGAGKIFVDDLEGPVDRRCSECRHNDYEHDGARGCVGYRLDGGQGLCGCKEFSE